MWLEAEGSKGSRGKMMIEKIVRPKKSWFGGSVFVAYFRRLTTEGTHSPLEVSTYQLMEALENDSATNEKFRRVPSRARIH
jgi:hypothetical protein